MLQTLARRLTILALMVAAVFGCAPALSASASSAVNGSLDTVSWSGATATLKGWAIDPAHSSLSISVLVTVDDRASGSWRAANVSRPDVNQSYRVSGSHGFALAVGLTNGSHRVCVTSRPYNSDGPTTQLGCATVNIYVAPTATEAQFRAEIQRIDPRHTVTWSFNKASGTESGWAFGNRVNISSGLSADWLRPTIIHEWSHVLQYRAFGANPYSLNVAGAAFNAVAGTTGSYGIEHGADCMALSLGATKLGYGCPAGLKVFGSRIAHGLAMTAPIGGVSNAAVSGAVFRTSGWVFDPTNPRASASVRITDNGKAITSWIVTKSTSAQINSAFGIPGTHGFAIAVRLSAGMHRLCVTTKPLTGSPITGLSCTTATTI